MKNFYTSWTFRAMVLSMVMLPVTGVHAQNKASTGVGKFPSIFVLPVNAADGRDPFFPESTRAMEAEAANTHTVEITALKVPGISGTPGHYLAIINTHTFSVGEEGDIKTASGLVHIRCLDIQPSGITVEINGKIHRIAVTSE
jgi:hypothetical protein